MLLAVAVSVALADDDALAVADPLDVPDALAVIEDDAVLLLVADAVGDSVA